MKLDFISTKANYFNLPKFETYDSASDRKSNVTCNAYIMLGL